MLLGTRIAGSGMWTHRLPVGFADFECRGWRRGGGLKGFPFWVVRFGWGLGRRFGLLYTRSETLAVSRDGFKSKLQVISIWAYLPCVSSYAVTVFYWAHPGSPSHLSALICALHEQLQGPGGGGHDPYDVFEPWIFIRSRRNFNSHRDAGCRGCDPLDCWGCWLLTPSCFAASEKDGTSSPAGLMPLCRTGRISRMLQRSGMLQSKGVHAQAVCPCATHLRVGQELCLQRQFRRCFKSF